MALKAIKLIYQIMYIQVHWYVIFTSIFITRSMMLLAKNILKYFRGTLNVKLKKKISLFFAYFAILYF